MNISKILLFGAFATICLSSCMNEVFPTLNSQTGSMSLRVDNLKPSATRAVETDNFPVTIYTASNNQPVQSYDKASLVPNKITLSVGEYYATSHTPGKLEKIMNYPYYSGSETFSILANINTVTTVICRMANGSFEARFSDDFVSAFKDWTVSIDDGSSSAIIYDKSHGQRPPITYMTFEAGVEILNVNFIGTTQEGNRITATNKLTKKQASEQYDSDHTHFSGGDAIVLVFNPVESTEGDITGITLTADIRFEESEESFEMEVEDNVSSGDTPGGEEGGEEGDDTPGGGDDTAITLNLPDNMTVSATTDPSLGDTYIAAGNGIKSIKVKMSSTSEDMISSLQDLAVNYEGVDFLAGAEVVDNQKMIKLFSDLGQTLAVPAVGDKEYTFPIGNFFVLLAFLPGEHTFDLIITDMDGNTKDGVLKLTVE